MRTAYLAQIAYFNRPERLTAEPQRREINRRLRGFSQILGEVFFDRINRIDRISRIEGRIEEVEGCEESEVRSRRVREAWDWAGAEGGW